MLDIVQSFTLLSYCIVSPIYISPICNVEIHYYEKIKIRNSLFFSLHSSRSPSRCRCLASPPFLNCNVPILVGLCLMDDNVLNEI